MQQNQYCDELLEKIIRVMYAIIGKVAEILVDEQTLPLEGDMSVESHRAKVQEMQRAQRRRLELYEDHCGDPPDYAWKWATAPIPYPRQTTDTAAEFQLEFQLEPIPVEVAGPAAFWTIVGIVLYNLKGCIFGPLGCLVDLASPIP